MKNTKQNKIWNASRICVSSLRRGHANLLCIVPILVYVLPLSEHVYSNVSVAYLFVKKLCDTHMWEAAWHWFEFEWLLITSYACAKALFVSQGWEEAFMVGCFLHWVGRSSFEIIQRKIRPAGIYLLNLIDFHRRKSFNPCKQKPWRCVTTAAERGLEKNSHGGQNHHPNVVKRV